MNRIDEEEDNNTTDDIMTFTLADQFPSVQATPECSRKSIYSSKQTSKKNDRSKYQTINRPTSLPPARHSSSSSSSSSLNENIEREVKQRRRYASDSNTAPSLLVTSFLQHLRQELKSTPNNKKNDYHHHRHTTKQKFSAETSQSILMNCKLSNENLPEPTDQDEILKLIDLLILRVECLANENKSNKKKKVKEKYPSVAEVDENLIEYLYYLFTKFTHEDSQTTKELPATTTTTMDKTNFVHVCQALVRNGCFDIPSTSPDQSLSETTTSSDQTLTQQTTVREYHADTDEMVTSKSSAIDQQDLPMTSDEQETWLVVDLEENRAEEEGSCLLPIFPPDDQLLLTTDLYKSCESESSPSIYLSPNSSSIDIQNMVQELNRSDTSLNEDGSSSNVIIPNDLVNDDSQSSSATNDNICLRLSNDDSSGDNNEQMTTSNTEKMSQREKKMQERWSVSTKTDPEQASTKPLLSVDFPPIAVLRRKFTSTDKKTTNNVEETIKVNPLVEMQEINTLPMTIIVDKTNPTQTDALLIKDVPLLICADDVQKNPDEQEIATGSELTCLSSEEATMKEEYSPLLLPKECQAETITNPNNQLRDDQQTNNENSSVITTNPLDSNMAMASSSPSCSPLTSISLSALTSTVNENKTIELLAKGKEAEEEKKEEEQHCNDVYNVDEEKKNNSSFVHDYHAPRILLINDEPTQTALLQQEKKEKEDEEEEEEEEEREKRERPSSPLPTLEQFNQQRTEDESPPQTLSSDINKMATIDTDQNDEKFKKVEIEEIPDDEETILTQNADSVEPIDYIHTDEEPKKATVSTSQSTISTADDVPIKFDNVFSCYQKALAKVVDTYNESSEPSNIASQESSTSTQQPADDPIALRALQRFEERMNAAAAKTTKEETGLTAPKAKSSWSGSLTAPRKSLENIFKNNEQQSRPTTIPAIPSSQSDGFIRPRKTFDDNNSPNYRMTFDLSSSRNSTTDKITDDDQKPEEHQQLTAIVDDDDKRVVDNKSMSNSDSQEQQQIVNHTVMSSEDHLEKTEEDSSLVPSASMDNAITTSTSQISSNEQPVITPYHFQLEGRRRLNTLDRMRERRQSRELLDTTDQQQQLQAEYTVKPEEVQDPIIRRALERFDEKNRILTQTKSMNYDDVQDPITRRALMRLESNLKRTIPPTSNDSKDTWYTENYTLGSLQPTNDRVSRYTDSSSVSPASNNKTKYISVHQRYCAPSSNDRSDLSTTNEHLMHAPAQPIYVTSNNQEQLQQSQPLSSRQRSRSEDMLATKDFSIGQTTNLDDIDSTSQLQRNRSSNEIAVNEPSYLLPNTLIKALEPHFVRTTESSVSYTTPTQTYSAYSCEYTRPRRNLLASTADASTGLKQESNQLTSSKYSQPQNETQRPSVHRPAVENQYQSQSSSAFAPVRSAMTTTSNYYSQQPLPTPSYGSMYSTSSNSNQTPYSEDPIVRRALERFNSQMQNSLLSTPQYQPSSAYSSGQNNFHETYINSNRPTLMTTSTSSNSSNSAAGYQSIIGRRRQTRYDEPNNNFLVDNTSVGDGYSSSLFVNSTNNPYMNMSDEPPAIPPRYRRDNYRPEEINDHSRRHSTDDYFVENFNHNNNNNNSNSQTLPREAYIHHAYPATITNSSAFRPINTHYKQQLSQEHDDFYDRAHSPTSTHSSDSAHQQRPIRPNNIRTQNDNQQRLPPSTVSQRYNGRRANEQIPSSENPQEPSGQTTPSNGSITGDSVFHRLAYTGTKASLSKSSSNSCSNLLNKNPGQVPTNQMKSCEIDLDDSLETETIENSHNNEQILTSASKYQRSKSVDGRARLKARANNQSMIDSDENQFAIHDEHQQKPISSSKFTPVNGRRDAPPPRVPLTPTSTPRTLSTKRPTNGTNLSHMKNGNGFRTHGSNGNFLDNDNQQQEIENDENISFNNDHYQTKLVDNRLHTSIPVHRYTTNNNNNNIQSSASTSSINSAMSRARPPVPTSINLDRRDSNASITDPNRVPPKRSDDNRLLSPGGQRRNIPVSVFSPAKLENKRPAPAPPTSNYESQQQSSYSSRSLTHDHDHDLSNPMSTNSSGLKTPTGNLLNDFSIATDKHDNNKKMNVFERLFRGNKKKN